MDPNKALDGIRDSIDRANESEEKADVFDWLWKAKERFDDLDVWLSKGGFLPDQWNKNRGTK